MTMSEGVKTFTKSLVSHDYFSDSGSDYNVNLDDSAEEEDDDSSLKSYVRRSYWDHLLQCIVHNYNVWVSSSVDRQRCSVTDLTMIASYLEHKAVRACMMANVYQQYMATMIKEIKQSSIDKKPYRNLLEHLDSIKLKWANKETQTETFAVPRKTSVSPSQVNRENLKNKFLVKKAKESKGEPLTNILNLPSDTIALTNSIDEIIHNMAANFQPVRSPAKPKSEENAQVMIETKERASNFPSLEERLAKFTELFGDEPESCSSVNMKETTIGKEEESIEDKRVLNWNLEMIAHTCQMNQALRNLPPAKKAKIETRYKDLFGGDNDLVSQPTIGEVAKCRKRTADLVVQELSPYYLDCRIASREIFKLLARNISRVVMQKTYAPEPRDIRNYVRTLFASGKSFLLSSDVMAVN